MALLKIRQNVGESVHSFKGRIRDLSTRLTAGGAPLDEMLLTLVTMHGLGDNFLRLRHDFALNREKYAHHTINMLKKHCDSYLLLNNSFTGGNGLPPASPGAFCAEKAPVPPGKATPTATWPPDSPPSQETATVTARVIRSTNVGSFSVLASSVAKIRNGLTTVLQN